MGTGFIIGMDEPIIKSDNLRTYPLLRKRNHFQ